MSFGSMVWQESEPDRDRPTIDWLARNAPHWGEGLRCHRG
jgi:hypothetical protein